MSGFLLIAASDAGAERLVTGLRDASGAWPAGVRVLALGDEPQRALLKLIEFVDLHLPREVVCVASHSDQAVRAPRLARNAGPAAELLDPSGPSMLPMTLPPGRWAGPEESETPRDAALNRLVYGLLRYASLRGEETWFQRRPPAGLDCRTGCLEIPAAAPAESLHRLLFPAP
jgi:hypothetical protein